MGGGPTSLPKNGRDATSQRTLLETNRNECSWDARVHSYRYSYIGVDRPIYEGVHIYYLIWNTL
jgi:hypothetical protein